MVCFFPSPLSCVVGLPRPARTDPLERTRRGVSRAAVCDFLFHARLFQPPRKSVLLLLSLLLKGCVTVASISVLPMAVQLRYFCPVFWHRFEQEGVEGSVSTLCQLTVYVVWTGTDSKGNYFTSFSKRLSMYADEVRHSLA